MADNHPIIPPHELVQEWAFQREYNERDWIYEQFIATQAAQWGADQELNACCFYLAKAGLTGDACGLQLNRRALEQLDD